MILNNFKNAKDFSIGAELELRILKKDTLKASNEYKYFENNISKKYKKYITPEFLQSMIEINTPVFDKPKDLINFFQEIIQELNFLANKKDLLLQTSGAPALLQEKIEISSNERYLKFYEEYKILLDNFFICGLHIHIGFETFDKALKAFNFSLEYLPVFVALSASSPFFNGDETGIHSYRTKIFDRLAKGSIPQYFDSYSQMKECYEILYDTKVIKSSKDIWWDIRIQDNLKTLEFRVCDAINDFERLEVIIGLAKAICKLSQEEETRYLMQQILKQNMWKATRYSMNADFIKGKKIIKIRDFIFELLEKLLKKALIDKTFYKKAKKLVKKDSIAKKMIKEYKKTKDLTKVEKLGILK